MRWYSSWLSWILLILVMVLLSVGAFASDSGGGTPDPAAAMKTVTAADPQAESVSQTPSDSLEVEGPARLEICFDLISHSHKLAPRPGESFQFFVVANGAEGGIRAWEARILIDERIVIFDRQADGMDVDSGKDTWRVGLGKNCGFGQYILLASYTARLKNDDDEDLVLGIAPIENGSFHPPSAGYLSCLSFEDKRTFAFADTAAVVNPVHLQLDEIEKDESLPRFQMQPESHGR